MDEKKFFLLSEPWIRVIDENAVLQEVSIRDVFSNAAIYKDLAGEIPMQNMAVFRFLLAIMHVVIPEYNINGEKNKCNNPDEIFERYEEIWQERKFPNSAFNAYLDEWEERFWLIHPKYPFYQVCRINGQNIGTQCSAAKLNGELFESNNQVQLFSGRSGKKKQELTFAEAARWILFLNSFDDCAAKNPSPKECWTGKLGLTIAKGKNLFETLMLNCQLLNENQECWPENRPSWEKDKVQGEKLKEIVRPRGPAELFTIQSRRISLDVSESDMVTGYQISAGDYFDGKNYFNESMTIWHHVEAKKNEPEYWMPQKYDPSKQVWQEFPTLIGLNKDKCSPGIIDWLNMLQSSDVGIINRDHLITFEVCSVFYGSMSCKIAREVHDKISFGVALLNATELEWQNMIRNMISLTENTGRELETLAYKIRIASSASQSNADEDRAKEQFYYQVDLLFRNWLSGLDLKGELSKAKDDWMQILKRISLNCAQKMALEASSTSFTGRDVVVKKASLEKKTHYSVPGAYNVFLFRINKLLNEGGK